MSSIGKAVEDAGCCQCKFNLLPATNHDLGDTLELDGPWLQHESVPVKLTVRDDELLSRKLLHLGANFERMCVGREYLKKYR